MRDHQNVSNKFTLGEGRMFTDYFHYLEVLKKSILFWKKRSNASNERYLYRGEAEDCYLRKNGRLIPAGSNSEILMKREDPSKGIDMRRNGEFVRTKSWINGVRAHHLKSGFADGCYISTSKDFNVAMRFATGGGVNNGYIYVLDRSLFSLHGVSEYEFINPRFPKELEVSIRAADGGEIPQAVVVEVKRVFSNTVL